MNIGQDLLLGIAIGDALGVPVEFKSRAYLRENPVTEMIEFGVHNQAKGTWSDDSSLSFCLADSLARNGYDLKDIASRILAWFNDGLWTAHGKVFDIGGQTRSAIDELTAIFKHRTFEELNNRVSDNEYANRNGALMRILPVVFETLDLGIEEKYQLIKEVGCLTHGHIRSTIACFILIIMAEELIKGQTKWAAYLVMQQKVKNSFERLHIPAMEQQKFTRILAFNISSFEAEEIKSDGYVVHSLEASLWSVLKNDTYKRTVLAAVNLGEDTDTIGAIAGGLAGLIYGVSNIPTKWKEALVGRKAIESLGMLLHRRYYGA